MREGPGLTGTGDPEGQVVRDISSRPWEWGVEEYGPVYGLDPLVGWREKLGGAEYTARPQVRLYTSSP